MTWLATDAVFDVNMAIGSGGMVAALACDQ
jgi:hypothetical protein